MSDRQIDEARAWIASCAWSDMDAEDIEALPGHMVVAGVEEHYAGGWCQFLMDTDLLAVEDDEDEDEHPVSGSVAVQAMAGSIKYLDEKVARLTAENDQLRAEYADLYDREAAAWREVERMRRVCRAAGVEYRVAS